MATGSIKKVSTIKTEYITLTTDQYGQTNLPYSLGKLINVWCNDYRYYCVKQNGYSVRVYSSATSSSGLNVVTNTAIEFVVLYLD